MWSTLLAVAMNKDLVIIFLHHITWSKSAFTIPALRRGFNAHRAARSTVGRDAGVFIVVDWVYILVVYSLGFFVFLAARCPAALVPLMQLGLAALVVVVRVLSSESANALDVPSAMQPLRFA